LNSRIRLGLAAAALSIVPFAAAAAKEPTQPATSDQITQYYEGGDYDADLKKAADGATKSLKSQLKKKPRKPAIVFDIDDTLESTYACEKASGGFGVGPGALCSARNDEVAIKPVWALLKLAQKKKVALYIITGRPQGIEPGTREKLKADGLKGKYTLVMRPNNEFGQPAAPYKAAARKAIQKRGFKILVNIGDQQSDLSGGSAVKRFKVPNPMYTNP
jgi:predicted secreted acid phosphatase